MNNKKRNRRYIDRLFHKYTSLYADLVSRCSSLTDSDRIMAINQFEIWYQILKYYYFNQTEVMDNDSLFNEIEKKLNQLEDVHGKFMSKKKTKPIKNKK